MKYTLIFDNALSCLIISANGPATVQDILAFVHEALNDDRWRSGMNAIVNYSQAELDALTSSEIHTLANAVEGLKEEIGAGRIAHVVSRTVDFGMLRMWENLVEDHVHFDYRIFRSMDNARRWLADVSI